MKNIASDRGSRSCSSDYIELAKILTRQIENLLIFPLARQGYLRQSDLETIEEVEAAIRFIALDAATFEKWNRGDFLQDSLN